jgi:hypothetical protein
MSCALAITAPIDRLDREQALMDRLVNESPIGLDLLHQTYSLLGTLGETIGLISSGDYARVTHRRDVLANLRALLVTGAGLARRSGVTLYHGEVWPDDCHTRIGGDGALATGHDPERLLGELMEAAGWVATWVHNLGTPDADNTRTTGEERSWAGAEPITELIARTWSLADRLDAREPLRALLNEHLSRLSAEHRR